MSRLNAPGPISTRPTANVYTGLAFISMAATLGAMIYIIIKFVDLGIFS